MRPDFVRARTAEEVLKVRACVFADGYGTVSVELLYGKVSEPVWNAVAMKHTGNDINPDLRKAQK